MGGAKWGVVRAGALLGMIAALGWLALRLQLLGEEPGTDAYKDLNRIFLAVLVLMFVALGGVYVGIRRVLDLLGHVGASIALIGSFLAAVGNAVEFQFGNGQAFMLFGLGLVLFAGGLFALGTSVHRRETFSMGASKALQLIGIFGFLASIAGPIGIIASGLLASAWVVIAIRARPDTRSGREVEQTPR